MRVHNILGSGFKEVIYKDALEVEFLKSRIPFAREKLLSVYYDEKIFPSQFNVDFYLYDKIILEVKSAETFHPRMSEQTKNYIKAAGAKLGIIVNFGEPSLTFKRVLVKL